MASHQVDVEQAGNSQMPKVTIGLHSQDGELSRSFVLDQINDTIHIGRASKSGEARLRAQPDNVWIESPIMSRDHAKISLSGSKSNPISIIDTGSTHGTFVEDERLEPHKEHALNNWDKVVFGVPVTSGRQTFDPKTFMVEFKQKEKNALDPTSAAPPVVNEQPNGFRVPSPSDSEDELSDKENEQRHNKREPSVELLSTGRSSGRAASEDVVFVSQSQIQNGKVKKNVVPIDLTDPDSPEIAAMGAKTVDSIPNPARVRVSEGPEVLKIVNVKEPLRSSGTYRLDYDEDEEDQDAQPDDEEEGHYEPDDEPDNQPSSVPDNIELIEELLDAPRSEQGDQEDMECVASSSVENDDQPRSPISPTYSPCSPTRSPVSPGFSPRSPSPWHTRDEKPMEKTIDRPFAANTLSENVRRIELLDRSELEREKHESAGPQTHGEINMDSVSSTSEDLDDDNDGMSTSDSSSSEDLDYPSSEEGDMNDSLDDASEFAGDRQIDDDESDGEFEEQIPAPVTKRAQENLITPVTAPNADRMPAHVASLPRPPSPSDAAMAKSIPPPHPWSMNAGRDLSFPPPPPPPPHMSAMSSPTSPPPNGQGSFLSSRNSSSRPGGALWNDPFYESPSPYAQPPSVALDVPTYHIHEPYPGDSQFLSFPASHTPYFAPAWYHVQQPPMTANDPPGVFSRPIQTMHSTHSTHSYVNSRPEPEARPSKVHISDIVNNTPETRSNRACDRSLQDEDTEEPIVLEKEYLTSQCAEETAENMESPIDSPVGEARTLKRKAAELEEDIEEEIRSDWELAPPVDDIVVADSQNQNRDAPNAQNREAIGFPSDTKGGSLPELASPEEPARTKAKKQATENKQAPIFNLLRGFSIAPTRGEPALKKLKVSQSAPKPASKASKPKSKKGTAVKTFVSGCIAGAVTVFGAAAALIATMPPSVQEEALRSL